MIQNRYLNFLTGLCTDVDKIHSSIVLAGDPKQLSAVTISTYAEKFGLKTSYMERLFNLPVYSRISGKFDPQFITQLTKNYRSHEAILHTPNELFYNNSLVAKADRGNFNFNYLAEFMFRVLNTSIQFYHHDNNHNTLFIAVKDTFIGKEFLPNKSFPILFDSIGGKCEKSNGSFYNCQEVEAAIKYVNQLLADNIDASQIGKLVIFY